MKERSIDNFMGRVLIRLVEMGKSESSETGESLEDLMFNQYKQNIENLSKDFYFQARKVILEEFWKKQLEKLQQEKLKLFIEADQDVLFAAGIVKKYLK